MSKEILISVVIPAYKCRKTITQAIDSVLIQEIPLEIIIIDDCSPEPVDDLIEQYHDDRIRFIKSETNIGASEARNLGVREASGEWIAFLDADDYWMEGKLKKQYDMVMQTGDVMCSTARRLMRLDGTVTERIIPVKEHIVYKDMLKQNWINNSSVLIQRSVLLEFPYEADEVHEDYLLWLRILKKYNSACAVNEPLLIYRVSNTGKSGNKFQSAIKTYRTYRKVGMNPVRAAISFASYCMAGVKKYYT